MANAGIAQRIQAAWHILTGGYNVKRAPFIWPAWREGQPDWQIVDLQSYVNEGFNLNSLIYSAVMFKVRSIQQAPLRAYEGDPDNPEPVEPEHPLAKLCSRPNPSQGWSAFSALNTVYLNLAGNVYIALDRPNRKAPPVAMYTLRPDRVWIIPQRGELKGFLYVPEGKTWQSGVPILPQDMMHIKLPAPGDPLEGLGYGLSPISPMAHSADVDNQITKFLKLFFKHGTMGNIAIAYDAEVDPELIGKLRETWKEKYGGYENWSEPIFLGNGAKVQRMNMTFDEMGFAVLDERNESRILGPFGVPPILIGTRVGLQRSTYSNYGEARRACWEDTLLPELRLFESEFQYYLQDAGGTFVAFDTSKVPALQKNVPELVTSARSMWDMGVPANTAFSVVGLKVEKLPWGNKAYVPIGMVEVGVPKPAPQLPPGIAPQPASESPAELPAGDEGAPVEDATEDEREGGAAEGKALKRWALSPEQKTALWHKADAAARKWEPKYGEAALTCLEIDRREVLALLSAAKKKAVQSKATVAWQDFLLNVENYLQMGGENWCKEFLPLFRATIADRGEQLSADFGMRFDLENIYATGWFKDYTMTFAQPINAVTKADIAAIMAQAEREGWTIPTAQKRLALLFDQYMKGDTTPEDWAWYSERMPAYRTELIARDQVQRASNGGTTQIYKEWGVKQHEWLATRDNRVRGSHLAADGQVVDMGTPFTVGGFKMMFPGDDSQGAPIELFIQDRCATLPVLEGD